MQKRKYFGTDGIRGKVGEFPITPDFALKLGFAAGVVLAKAGSKKVLIGKDTRISNYMLESAIESGLAAAGLNASFTGPMPTPAIAYLTKTFRAEAGIVLSASHNHYSDNGIKFFASTGDKLDDSLELKIEAQLEKPIKCVPTESLGKAVRIDDAAGRYIEFCKSTFPARMSLSGLKIVVDCANGAAYNIAPVVFEELGAKVIKIGCKPNGININEKCGATDLSLLQKTVVEQQADLGIALDGDGDRLMMVTSKGAIIDGDEIVFIIARDTLRLGKLTGGVVGTKMSNLGLEKGLLHLGVPFLRADVGDRYVLEKLKEKQWLIGGESSGHIINKRFLSTGDGIIAALQVLKAMQNSHMSFEKLTAGMDKYPQILKNVKYQKDKDPIDKEVLEQVEKINAKLANKGRVLLRKSGTEPLIRIMVEGESKKEIMPIVDEIYQLISKKC